jgi:flagellar hook-length control protein FliK
VRGLSAVLQQGGGTLVLRLTPATLGALTIQLDLSGTHVGVRVEASTAQAHELLSQQLNMLKSSLEAKGLTVDRLQVHISAEAARAESQQGSNAQDQGRSGRGEDAKGQSPDAGEGESKGKREGEHGRRAQGEHQDEGEARSAFEETVRLAVDTQA